MNKLHILSICTAMKPTLLFIFLAFFGLHQSRAQESNSKHKLDKRIAVQLIHHKESSDLKRSDFTEQMYTQLGLESADDLQTKKVIKGLNGWNRIRMQQMYKGLRVVGAAYILHEKDDVVKKSSGDILPYINLNITPNLKDSEANLAAEKYTNSKLLSLTEGKAIVLPAWDIEQTELVVMDIAYPEFSGSYTLAYHVIISNLEGINQYRESIYVDANSGKVLESISEIAHTNVEGIAQTKYYGEQTIITDSISTDLFILRDMTRGDGIITLNGDLDDFTDEDNFWNNFGNKEEVGTDAHYCAAAYHDYMVDEFDWAGLDGEGLELRSRVFGDELNAVNATWNGSFATFFSGDCDEYGPLTTLVVVGHEFAHGFTDFTSDLIYQNESGAINESISDILGKALEFTYDYENRDWFIGSKFLLTDEVNNFRDMSNPNNRNHPKLYGGEFWEFGTRDNGGVHINSGVLNFWYYLLSEGQADVNELGVEYDVSPIGFEKAADIVFTMNTAYLTESSTYTKAVGASIESVKDLFGENAPEMASVLEAWKAVGLFPESGNYDIKIELLEDRPYICVDELEAFPVEVNVFNVGLEPYLVGDMLNFSYSIEGQLESEEDLLLTEDLLPGETLYYVFEQFPTSLIPGDNFDLEVFVEATALADPNAGIGEIIVTNNNDEARLTTTELAGLDVKVTSFTLTARRACEVEEFSQVRLGIQNTGCTEIPEGDYPLTIIAAGSEYVFDITLPFNLRSGSFATIFDLIVVPDEIENGTELMARFNIPNDTDAANNDTEVQYLFLETVTEGYIETFNTFDIMNNTEIFIDPDFRADAQIENVNGDPMLIISGTNSEPFNLENCEDQELFFRENFQVTDIEMCVNTIGIEDATFSFDLIQHRWDEELFNVDPSYSVMVQVSIDDNYDVTYPIISGQSEGERLRHDFILPPDFSDAILIEVMTLRGNGATITNGNFENGDFALIDNIQITSGTVSTQQIENESAVQVFPNPSSSVFNFAQEIDGAYDLMIYDGLGRLIHQQNTSNKRNIVWDVSQVVGGIYFYDIHFENGLRQNGKLVVSE